MGSSQFKNFADSIFGIGASSTGDNRVYICQTKARQTEKVFGSKNVIHCEIKKEVCFLSFHFVELCEEKHLLEDLEGDKPSKEAAKWLIIDAKRKNPTLPSREAEQMVKKAISHVTIENTWKKVWPDGAPATPVKGKPL